MLEQTLGWPHAALLAAKLQFGLGVLAIPTTFRSLGVVPGVACLLFLSIVAALSPMDMQRIHALHPDVDSLPTLHGHLFGAWGSRIFATICFLFTTSVVAAGMVTTSIALNEIASQATCMFVTITVVAAVLFVIGTPLRQLQRVSWLGWVGFVCVASAVYVLALAVLIKRNVWWPHDIRTPGLFSTNASFDEQMNAISIQLICVCGTMSFYGLLIEMRDRHLFTRATLVGQTVVLLNNLGIGLVMTMAAGQHLASPTLSTAGATMQKICYAIALPGLIVSALLYANLTAKQLYVQICRRTQTKRTWLAWTGCMLMVIVCAFVAAQAIPMFEQILGLIGSVAGPCFVFVVPAYTHLYLMAMHKEPNTDLCWCRVVLGILKRGRNKARLEIMTCFLALLIGIALMCVCTTSGIRLTLNTLPKAYRPFVCEKK
jgi:hypothetical protein